MAKQHLKQHPNGIKDEKIRRGGYSRYNGGDGDRYYWWSTGPANHNGVPLGWMKFGYISVGKGIAGFRDYNNDNKIDPDGNPYNIPGATWKWKNQKANRAARYADQCIIIEKKVK